MNMKTCAEIAETPEYKALAEECRATCLWSMEDALHPRSEAQLELVLSAIEKHGDLSAFRRAGEIRKWRSAPSRQTS